MPFSLHRSSKVQLPAFGLVMLCALVGFAWGTQSWKATKPVVAAAVTPLQQPQKSEADPTTYIPVEEVTLRPHGFYPRTLSRPKGQFLLNICNRAELVEANFTLVRVVGNGTKEKVINSKVHQNTLDWSTVLDLNPGTYFLTEDSNPKWSCELTITAK